MAGAAVLSFGALNAAAAPMIDMRPSMLGAPAAASAAAPGAGSHYEIHIHVGSTAGGASADDIATAVRREIERIEREKGRRAVSSFSDRG